MASGTFFVVPKNTNKLKYIFPACMTLALFGPLFNQSISFFKIMHRFQFGHEHSSYTVNMASGIVPFHAIWRGTSFIVY